MLLYSNTTLSFIQRVREEIRALVNFEVSKVLPISMQRSRVLYNKVTYPLSIVVFEDKSRLGYFDSQLYELGISKILMLNAQDEVLKNIIRHELAHFICYITFGSTEPHGEKFKSICRQMNWSDEVERAYANIAALNEEVLEKNTKTEHLLSKLKKLMALASSDNAHEAETATLKANQLLLEHNLSFIQNKETDDEAFVVKRVLKGPRKSTKHEAIYSILQTFCVAPVMNYGTGIFYLEVTGDNTSVMLADYVANFLDYELEVLWKNAQKENRGFKGLTAKNSFFRGVAAGYVMKINQEKSKSANCNDLVLIENNLSRQKSIAYPRLHGSSAPNPKNDSNARNIGVLKGRNLSIKPGLNASTSRIFLLQ